MRIKTMLLAAAAGLVLAAAATPALADAGDWQVRVRALGVLPDSSGTVTVNTAPPAYYGINKITDSVVPEIDFTYFITKNIGAELIAATTQHSVHVNTVGDIGSVWLLPPTLTVQYHFQPDSSSWRPYVGAGINYTFFYTPHSPLAGIHYKDNVGFALQGGIDVPIGGHYFLNADIKKIFLSTDVSALAGVVTAKSVKIDPLLIGLGVGYRF